MSGKTKAQLQAEIELLQGAIAVKDDYIETLQYLLECEERENCALRQSNDVGLKAYEQLHIGRVRAELRRKARQAFYVERFVFHHLEERLNPFRAETAANRDVRNAFGSGKGYEKSKLYRFRAEELKKYFPKRKRPLER